jgi:hypothetical protein
MCGSCAAEAMQRITEWELLTQPNTV